MVASITKRQLLTKIFRLKSPSAGWRFINNWYLPKSTSLIAEWNEKYEKLTMHRGEDPMDYFSRADEILDVLESFGDEKDEMSVNRRLVHCLSVDYLLEKRTILADDNISRERIEHVVRRAYTGFVKGWPPGWPWWPIRWSW